MDPKITAEKSQAKSTEAVSSLASDPMLAKGTPIWFAREILKIELYPWQERVLWDLAVGTKPVFMKAANGSGKTQGIATIALLWHAATFRNSQGLTTAGVYRQVKEQLWGNLRTHAARLGPKWQFNATDLHAPNGSKALGFSTDDPHKFEGWHNNNQLIILDEAKSIPDEIWEAVQRCNVPENNVGGRLRVLVMSSTGGTEGFFPLAFTKRRKFFSCHSVTAYDCPHLSDKWVNEQIEMWGRNHPLIRSMIFSEFVDSGGSQYVCSPVHWTNCMDNPPVHEDGAPLAFIDWAAGGDENVIAVVKGNKVTDVICWRDKNTMMAANRAAIELTKLGVPVGRTFADDGGLGHPINDAMEMGGFQIRRVLNNMKPTQPDHYANLGAELWYIAARAIEKREIILPKDDVLMEQATTRRSSLTPVGKLALEKKDDMRRRGVSSPDRADAVLSAIAIAKTIGNQYDVSVDSQFDGLTDTQLGSMEDDHHGMFSGL